MRKIAIICLAIMGASVLSAAPVFAQQKTVKACQEEWRANKAANQAKGITEMAYVTQCRAGGAAAQPAQQTPPPTTAAPAAPKTTAVPTPRTTPPARSTAQPAPAPAATTAPTGANQYSTEAQAKARCGSGLVVWVNLDSKIYHFAGYKSYGKTKSGAYMCETDATRDGMRAAKNEKHP